MNTTRTAPRLIQLLTLTIAVSAALTCCRAVAGREILSPGFQAAWIELQRDGHVYYHCLVDTRNCDAQRLDLVVQFRWATNDTNIMQRGGERALMLFPQSWRRPAEDMSDGRWRPLPVEIPASLWEQAELNPGEHDVDAIFDLFDPDADQYVAGGWIWRATLRISIAADGKATVVPYFPDQALPLPRKPGVDTCPTIVEDESPVAESVPPVLEAYGWKPKQVLGTSRLRHGGSPSRVAFCGAGGGLLSADEEGNVLLWDGEQGALQRHFQGRLLIAEDGTTLVLTSGDETTLVDPTHETPQCRIDQPPPHVLAAGLTTDANSLVLVDQGSVGEWDVASGRQLSRYEMAIENPDDMPVTASVSRCGRLVALACNRGKVNCVTVFDVGSGRKVLSTVMDYGIAPPLLVCDGGRRLALPAPQFDGRHPFAIFDIASGAKQFDFATNSPKTPLVVDNDGSKLAVVDSETLVLLDPATGQTRRIPLSDDDAVGLEFSRDGAALAVSGYQGVRIVAASTGETLAYRPASGQLSVLSADGTRVVSADLYGQLVVWNARSGQVELQAAGFRQPISQLAASADGRRLAAVSESGACRVWEIADGATLLSLRAPCSEGTGAAQVALSPDGSQVVIATVHGGDPLVWSVQDKRVTTALLDGGVGGGAVAFTPNGRLAVACHYAGGESALHAWDLPTGESVFRDRFLAAGLAMNCDGSDLLALDLDAKRVRRYDWLQRRPMDDFAVPAATRGLACSSDGRLIVCGGELRQARGGELIAALASDTAADAACLFAPDNRCVLAVTEGEVQVFDAADGRCLRTITGPWKITAAAFSPDGKTLWTGLETGAVVGWAWEE